MATSNATKAIKRPKRLESIEQRRGAQCILPTAKLGPTLDEIRSRLDRLEARHQSPPINHD